VAPVARIVNAAASNTSTAWIATEPNTMNWILLFALALLPAMAWPATEGKLAPDLVNPGYHDKPAWFKQSFLDLPDDVREAAASGRRLMLFFYQDGCPYCKVMLMHDLRRPEVAERTRRRFDVIAINLWGDLEVIDLARKKTTEKQFARDLAVQFTPTILLLDDKGKVALRMNGYYPPEKFLAAIESGSSAAAQTRFAANAPAGGKLHSEPGALQPPYRFADALARTRKPLVVMFEHPGCGACDELHRDILKRAESRAQLARFTIAIVDPRARDTVQTPDGKSSALADWARALGVQYAPTLVFFEAGGREVFRAEADFKAFHVQSMFDYVASGSYRSEPQFQRYVQRRADELRARGQRVELMK
jgi:thioredoxin-related protein